MEIMTNRALNMMTARTLTAYRLRMNDLGALIMMEMDGLTRTMIIPSKEPNGPTRMKTDMATILQEQLLTPALLHMGLRP